MYEYYVCKTLNQKNRKTREHENMQQISNENKQMYSVWPGHETVSAPSIQIFLLMFIFHWENVWRVTFMDYFKVLE